MSSPNRFSLDIVSGLNEQGKVYTKDGTVCVDNYSRFKHGDGDVSETFGLQLAEAFSDQYDSLDGGHILVTSSAYKAAPPASESLLEPFTTRLQERFPAARVEPFKIDRTVLTQGDYATMSIEQREDIMKRNGLKLPKNVDIHADAIIALDDILVTGSHEVAVQNLFDRSGVTSDIYYAYLLKVGEGVNDPRIEAAVNYCAVRSLSDVVKVANNSTTFIPNARVCKMIVSSGPEDIAHFSESVEDADVLETIHEYIQGDELDKMQGYTDGARLFARFALARLDTRKSA